jgi:polyisoprenyl-phosphate glycosyltransferase
MKKPELSFVLPTLNEAANVITMCNRLNHAAISCGVSDFEIIFVDDKSDDNTVSQIREIKKLIPSVKYLLMSRRFGDQESLMAGIEYAKGRAVIIMDSDLQHPPEYVPDMVDAWRNGADAVIMQRKTAGHSNYLTEMFEILFYKLLMLISFSKIYYRFAGFALLDHKVAKIIREFKEVEPFLRGIIPFVGFNQIVIEYDEGIRNEGESKYTFMSKLRLALRGLTSFSIGPLVVAIWIGLIILTLAICFIMYVMIQTVFFQVNYPQGWLSIMIFMLLFSGIQITILGVIGLYLSKVFIQIKGRPRYVVEEFSDSDK